MSLLGRYLDWFGDQDATVQIGSTVALFALLFISGIYTAGIVPGVVLVAVLVDHWLRGRESTND